MACEIDVNTSISGNVINVVHQTPTGSPVVIANNVTMVSGLNFLPNVPVTSGIQFRIVFPGQNPIFFIGGSTSVNHPSIGNGNDSVGRPLEPGLIYPVKNLNELAIAMLPVSSTTSDLNYFAITVSG